MLLQDQIFHVNTTVTRDPHRGVMINYHTTLDETFVVYTTFDDPSFLKAIKVKPKSSKWSTKGLKNASPSDSFAIDRWVCYCELNNLLPGCYIYKIVGNGIESKIFQFTIEEKRDSFSFLCLADMQYGGNPVTPQFIKDIRCLYPDITLCIGSGDIVDFGDKEEEWTNIIDSDAFNGCMVAFAPGDHEYWGDDSIKITQYEAPHTYLAIFHNPLNGAPQSMGSSYYFIYHQVLFIMLDMNDSNSTMGSKFDEQAKWIRKVLEEHQNEYKFSIVSMHKSIFGSQIEDSNVYKNIRPVWYSIFNEYKVDLVLSGHDHMYSRTYPLSGDTPTVSEIGTTYLDLGTSGNKRRHVDESLTKSTLHAKVIDLKEIQNSLCAIVSIENNTLVVKVYNLALTIVDTFQIKKY